jgi:hypothetical protein
MRFCLERIGTGQVLDTDGSGSLSMHEFCASIKKLVRFQHTFLSFTSWSFGGFQGHYFNGMGAAHFI